MKRKMSLFLAVIGFALAVAACNTKAPDTTSDATADSLRKVDSTRIAADSLKKATAATDTSATK